MKYLGNMFLIVFAALALACESGGGGGLDSDATNPDAASTDGTDGTDGVDGTTATDGSDGTDSTDSTESGDPEAGQVTYQQYCSICHGPTGAGGVGAALTEAVPELTDEEIRTVITEGKNTMPSFASFSEEELSDVVAFLRAEFGE